MPWWPSSSGFRDEHAVEVPTWPAIREGGGISGRKSCYDFPLVSHPARLRLDFHETVEGPGGIGKRVRPLEKDE
jgi:hypothetical protein